MSLDEEGNAEGQSNEVLQLVKAAAAVGCMFLSLKFFYALTMMSGIGVVLALFGAFSDPGDHFGEDFAGASFQLAAAAAVLSVTAAALGRGHSKLVFLVSLGLSLVAPPSIESLMTMVST